MRLYTIFYRQLSVAKLDADMEKNAAYHERTKLKHQEVRITISELTSHGGLRDSHLVAYKIQRWEGGGVESQGKTFA